ncbi:CotG/ExsB N-terminal domain-containing protein, partial [Neobacillus drentensis]|uniref:CotG/ExsB N-terminal domain-containing protein n=1 Tax=Neobacillus drentensis TaxID=220684 RepID=UPI003B58A12B
MSNFSPEDIQRAADEVRHGDFWDFLFRDPSQNRRTTRRRTSRRRTSRQQRTSRMNTSRRNTSRVR